MTAAEPPPPARPLDGVRVVELAVVIAGPSAGAILGDWGATVVKIEPPDGDPQRGNLNTAYFELDNRGKRSVGLDLKTEGGRDVARRLVARADVFLTNLRPDALRRLGLDFETLHAAHPGLVYAAITGYGTRGPGAAKAGYDIGAFWSRAGVAAALTPEGETPPVARPGMGDHTTGLAAAAGVAAALFARERTGGGRLVDASLLRSGTYTLGSDLISHLQGFDAVPGMRRMQHNPLLAVYRSGDGRWFWLLGVQATRHWPGVTRAIGRPELAEDERFRSMGRILKNRHEVLAILDEAFATEPMAVWAERFAAEDIWWDPVQTLEEVVTDPLVLASGAFLPVEDSDRRTVATPVDFPASPMLSAPRAPEAGEHTEEVLLELGWDWAGITDLRDRGVI